MSELTAPGAATGFTPRPAAAEWRIMAARSLRLTRRKLDALLTSLLLPVMLMLMFVYLFGGAIRTGTAYQNYVVPGVLVLCAGFGAALTAVQVSEDMTGGIIDRFRSMDISGAAALSGPVAASLVRNTVSAILVLGAGFLIGFRPDAGPLDWIAAAGILLAFILALSWLSAAIGLVARSPEAANGFTFLLMFLPYASSAFVPINTMPAVIRGFAHHQPVTPVIDSVRGLLMGTEAGASPWLALAWCGGILAVSVALSGVLFRRRAS